MRILILTQWFNPEPNFKGLLFAKELVKRGHEVEVLTGFPNYPEGKIYDGYKIRLFQKEMMDGIPIIRVPLYPSHDTSAIKRIINYASFSISAATIGSLLIKPADVMYVMHPPATVGLPAVFISLVRKIPFIYDIQDLWPDTLGATGMLNNEMALSLVGAWCRFIYWWAKKIVVLSPGFKKALVQRGVKAEKIEVIYNWCEENHLKTSVHIERPLNEFNLDNKFNIIFAGTMGKAQALDAVLDAAALIQQRYPKIQFVFIGGGIEVDRLKRRAEQELLKNVTFVPRKPVSEIGPILQFADALLVHLKDDPLFQITIPSKIQAYLTMGKPILMGVKGDAAELVKQADAGVLCTPEDSESIADAAIKLYLLTKKERDKLGVNGKKFYAQKLSLAVGTEKFEEIFQTIAEEDRINLSPTKRLFDVAVSFAGLIVLSPVLLLTALIVRVKLGTPVIFSQKRPGLHNKPFIIYKFHTMTDFRDSDGNLLPDADRLTKVGKFLRSSSLDELPELFNVLKGDMSLVGPRPLLMRYTPYFSERERKRFTLLPGITGWAQINGRNKTSWDQRLGDDVWYVENRSFLLDLKIIFKTFLQVFKSEGVVVDANSIMLDLDQERSHK